jgi:hypothetical protein
MTRRSSALQFGLRLRAVKKLDEAAAGALAAGANNGRAALYPGTDQHQPRRDLVGQYDRLLLHNRPKARLRKALFQGTLPLLSRRSGRCCRMTRPSATRSPLSGSTHFSRVLRGGSNRCFSWAGSPL